MPFLRDQAAQSKADGGQTPEQKFGLSGGQEWGRLKHDGRIGHGKQRKPYDMLQYKFRFGDLISVCHEYSSMLFFISVMLYCTI